MSKKLDGKVAIVTGGNSGIGEATCHLFAKEGAKVALMARREPEGQKVQDAIRAEGGDATFIACDVGDRKAVDAAVAKTVETYGGVDILFNNAGGGSGQIFPDEDDDNWDRIIRVNLTGTFYMSRAAWPHLVEAGGGAITSTALNIGTGLAPELQRRLERWAIPKGCIPFRVARSKNCSYASRVQR